ncbi:hypothetical protein OHA61_12200 [Streptomyces sp. NBC_00885]|uniref:hypothetical protein n=1 Tax=Streptomyces sp. NBC_00885 TaxID=2975857 RepID=UPI00386EA6D4|nr:hypothetical protein OHA61_12200 [Streptomyces sp. NBC_00885]
MSVLVSSSPFGMLDLDDACRWGYGWDPKKSMDWKPKDRVMTEEEYGVVHGPGSGGAATIHGRKVPENGCSGEADKQLISGVKDSLRMWSYVSGRQHSLTGTEPRDARIRQAWDIWSQCVVDKGLGRYRNPDKAFEDKAWQRGSGGNTTRTERELATATADVECKRSTTRCGCGGRSARRCSGEGQRPAGTGRVMNGLRTPHRLYCSARNQPTQGWAPEGERPCRQVESVPG